MDLDKELQQTFELKLTRWDGEETILKQTFPQGTDIWGMAELFRSFLLAITYSDCTINQILVTEEESEQNYSFEVGV